MNKVDVLLGQPGNPIVAEGPWWRVDEGPSAIEDSGLNIARMKSQIIRVHVNFPLYEEAQFDGGEPYRRNDFFEKYNDDLKGVHGMEGIQMLTKHSMLLAFGYLFDKAEFIADVVNVLDKFRAAEPIVKKYGRIHAL